MSEFLSLKNHVYEYIADQIGSGNLRPDEKINEAIICEELNISRTPVREALIELAAEGLLENIPRKGFVISKLDEREAIETYLILGVLDGYAASQACERLTDKEIKQMEFYIKSMDLAIESGNYDIYYKHQEEFHQIYTEKCGNASLDSIIRQIKKKFLRKQYIIPKGEDTEKVLLMTNDEHKTMLAFFKKKDAAGIEKFMREVHWEPDKAYMEAIE